MQVVPQNNIGRSMMPDHGTRARYKRGCKCELCRAAEARYFRSYRKNGSKADQAKEAKTKINKSKGNSNGWDLEVVSTNDLMKIIDRWVLGSDLSDPVGVLALRIKMDKRQLERMIARKWKNTSLILADRLLVAIGRSEALSNGELQIIPNPRMSMEAWIEKMQERGCY